MTATVVTGQGRITVFSMFGPTFAYVSQIVEGERVAYIGPVTPGVQWRKLRQMAAQCSRINATAQEKARWVVLQAHRALVCGDVIVKLSDEKWEMTNRAQMIDVGNWCGHSALVLGDMYVPSLAADQVASRPTRWPNYAA
jgi:hypothetical protein